MLYVVGFGPGSFGGMTVDAEKAISLCKTVVGYTVYNDILREFFPDKEYISTAMRGETERVVIAVEKAKSGIDTALVCSGDSGVYGMAGLAIEAAHEYGLDEENIEIIPGVSAAMSGAAVLGAPLTHDFAVISLSDLMTPWEKIEKRLECAADADLSVVIYNPSSKKRSDYLAKACDIMMKYKSGETVCGYVKNIGRFGQESGVMTLAELRDFQADMFTTVFVGNSETKRVGGKIVTPRGYKSEKQI